MNFLFSILSYDANQEHENGRNMSKITIKEIFLKFADFYYCLVTKSMKFDTSIFTDSISCKMNFYKHLCEDLNSLENTIKFDWNSGNCNFDKQKSYYCQFLSSDKVSITKSGSDINNFIVFNNEDLSNGIWHISFDTECVDDSVDFVYGFISSPNNDWPTDYVSMKKLLKRNSSMSISYRSSRSHRLSCVIDIDQSFLYFSNNNNRIQTFNSCDCTYRFFIASLKNYQSSFQIQMISVKQLCLSDSDSNVEFYNNLCICPDYYILLSDLYSGFNHLLTISSQTNLQDIISLLIEKSNFLNQFDLFFDKNISTSEISSILLFGLFIFNEFYVDQRFFRGESCIFSTVENRKENICSGVILNFKFKSKIQLHGLNFVEQITKSEDVICSIYSTASNKSILIPLTLIQKAFDNKIPKKSAFIIATENRQITADYIMAILASFFNAIPTTYFDVDITNYEGMDWSNKLSERCKIEYHFIKYHYFRLVMEFMASTAIIDIYLNSDNEKFSKILESFFARISNLAIKTCPIRKNMNICNFNGVTAKLLEGFYQLYSENELSLVKKYAYLYMENYKSLDLKGFLSKNERRTLLRTLKKQPIDKNLIESFTTKSKDNSQLQQESRAVTFSDRRRRLGDCIPPHISFQNQIPAEEYDSSHSSLMEVDSSLSSDTVNESPSVEANQRLMDEFVLRKVNKAKKNITCPICETSIKYQSQSLFLHLSNQHSLNCRKSFQHHASNCINSDGTLSNLDNSKYFCASITFNGYCVCDEYLKNKFAPKKLTYFNENLNDFVNEGYLNNILIGWSGTLTNEYYSYQKISEFCLSDNIRPKLDQIKILGDHIRQEINYSSLTLNSNSYKIENHDDYLDRDIYFICQLNVAAIIMSLRRLEYAFLVISSRNLIVNLAKQIFQKNSSSCAITMTKRFFFNDYIFAMNIIRFYEGGRIALNCQNQQISNGVKCVEFKDSDFLSVIILGLESSLDNHDKIHQFIVTYIQNLENFLSSSKDYFNLNTDFDNCLLIRPSTLIIQLLFNTTVKVLFTRDYITSDDHQFWQSEIEQIMELLSFGIINENTVSKVKIWCLQNLMQMFQLIQSNNLIKNPDPINMVDLCEDLSIEDSPTIHLANCNATVKKLISVMNRHDPLTRHSILTADCEGTMRLWDIDSIIGTEQNLRQTFLFSLGDQILKNSSDRKSPEIMEKCLRMTEPLRTDLSNYLVQVGVQNIAVSSTGFYLAESLGIYLNIWSTRSIFSKPYVASFVSLITSLIFPQQTFMGLHGCLVDLLLVCLADGELLLLRIFDNGTRVTQYQIPGLSDIQSNVTMAAWDEEKNLIAVGYHDGSIVLTDQIGNKIILETVHNNRILFLLYCPYVTQFEQYLLASSSVDETKVAIWKKDNLMCVLKLLSPITCLEWLSRKYIHEDKYHVIITGSSSGLIQFWQFDDSGDSIQNVITFCGHLSPISKLRICESTNLLASGCNNGWVNVWSLKDHSLISTCNGDGNVIGIEWTLQNNLVTAFSRSQYIKIWRYFNSNTLQKNGIRQWAYVRKIFLESTKTKSIKNLKNLKHFTLSIHKLLNEQFIEEVESVKSGFSIVYSQYLQCLIQFAISLDFIPKLAACSSMEPIDVNNNYKSPCLFEITNDTYQHRGILRHLLNLNGKALPNHHLDWLFMIDEMVKLTQSVCFECKIPENIIPKWWWVWCVGSEELVHHYIESKWNNNHWSMKEQTELYQWYQNSPDFWIKEYSDSTYIWGCGIKGELGFSTKADWVKPTLASIDGIQQIVCGSGVTLLITCENKLMACGEGLEVIFNPFMREETFQIINVPVLNDYKIAHVSASRGPESHIIAITIFGEVFSWGIGSHGKLGHGHATTLKKPKSIETLRGKGAIMSDCGHMHSAVVTASGELYTFGLGANGQLGIEILTGCDTPRLVNFGDVDVRIGFVSCGVNHTLALSTDGLKLFAFGDGACGKLGVGDVNDHFSPVLVNFHDKPLLKVACGQDFSVALTKNGNVYTWGHSDFIGISSSNSELDLVENHVSYPTHISSLNVFGVAIDICAGNNTTFALISTGNLYGWGSNQNNLLRLGSKTHAYNPELILINKDLHLQQISCGRHHVAVSSHAPYSYRNNIPSGPQFKHSDIPEISSLKYQALDSSGFNLFDMTARLIFLLYWNEMIRLTWQFWIPQTNQHYDTSDYDTKHYNYSSKSLKDWPHINNRQLLFSQSNWNWKPFSNFQNNDVRQFINTEFISSAIYRYLNGSMINNRTYTSLVRIDRINKKEPVFIQTCRQVLNMDAASLRLPWRAWKVKLINEGADDAGGAYDETISEICNELESEDLFPRILIPVPSDPSTFVPNPDIEIPHQYFNFLGILMATAIRTKKPIDLHLDPIFWKRMTKSVITVDDLIRLDPSYFNSLLSMNEFAISGNENIEEIYGVDKFVCFSISKTESEVCYKGLEQRIEKGNISDFVRSCIYYRLHEFDNAIEHIRKSFCNFAPMVLLDVMNWKQLEKMVCGSQHISIDILKNIARYVDVDESDILFSWFWEILESFNESEKSLFLRFVTGKSRLPSQDSHIPFRLFIHISKQPVNSLPQSQTCFNQIRLPRYKSRTDMETCLRIAISQCRSIDMDDYMLIRNRENDI